jgi:polysaccharide export outer membrane protein
VRTALSLACASLCACALAPGMRLDEGAAESRGRKTTGDANYQIELITPALLSKLFEQSTKEGARLADPSGTVAPAPYTVAPYDVLHVTVWDHPELTAPSGQFRSPEEQGNPVSADGTMYYPYVGIMKVAGLTLAEIRALLTQRLASVIARPQLDVRVASFRGKRVQVTGEVLAPSTIPLIDVPIRVQDAISFAKGFTPDADPAAVTLTRNGKVYPLDLLAFYEGGDTSQNWLLQDGDLINVGDRNRNRVFVVGEVRLPQAKLMVKRRMTLAEALGDSGWLDPIAANAGKIYVIRGDYSAPSIFHLDASSPDALLLATAFQLKPRDVVFVSTYRITQFNRVIAQILPTVQVLYEAAITADLAGRIGK